MSNTLSAILRAVEYIEDNLQNPVAVGDAASEACYSLYHFIRLFEGFTGHTPKDYILRRRIAEAASELRQNSKKIIDVCFDYQFGSPEAFSRAFKKIAGISPAEMRKCGYYDSKQLLSRIDEDSIRHVENILETPVEEVFLDAFNLAGVVNLIRSDKKIIEEMWGFLANELKRFPETGRTFYGLSFWPDDYDVGGFYLMCGCTVPSGFEPSGPLCMKNIPPSRYLKFVHKGDVRTIASTYRYIFETFLPKSDYRLTKAWDIELYKGSGGTEILIPFG
ncbi:MAG: AraC family transcriptional regulator [Spirochaetales bacterium]|nr:AraC family transcriptional regulator [Spirochaetales bacterium]